MFIKQSHRAEKGEFAGVEVQNPPAASSEKWCELRMSQECVEMVWNALNIPRLRWIWRSRISSDIMSTSLPSPKHF